MARNNDINLDGTETLVLKSLGLMGGGMDGATLQEKVGDMMIAELIDCLQGLVGMGYVDADKTSFHNAEEFSKTHFHVNSGYARDLKDAMDPRPEPKKSRRVRRE